MLERLLPSHELPKDSSGHSIRQYAVVTDAGARVLVLQFPSTYRGDAKNSWTLPGGGLQWKENPRAGMFRELSEETGLRPDLGWRVRVDRTRRLKDRLWVCYRGVASDTAVRLSREHQAHAWVTEEELRALVFYHGKLRDIALEMMGTDARGWDLNGES